MAPEEPVVQQSRTRGYAAPGIVLGISVALMFDLVVFYRVAGWNYLLIGTGLSPFWYGFLQVLAIMMLVLGVCLLYTNPSGRRWKFHSGELWGWMMVGFGAVNLLEVLISGRLLAVHRLIEGSQQLWWDAAFLVLSLGLVVFGWILARVVRSVARREAEVPTGGPLYLGHP